MAFRGSLVGAPVPLHFLGMSFMQQFETVLGFQGLRVP